MFRIESASQEAEGSPIHARAEEMAGSEYRKAFRECRGKTLSYINL